MYSCSSDSEALQFCERVARSHYENFPVGSLLIDSIRRPAFYAVYAFARMADDIADAWPGGSDDKVRILRGFAEQLHSVAVTTHPVFRAMRYTVEKTAIRAATAERLLVAFQMDSQFSQPKTTEDLLHYCTFSANPVGELLLQLYDENSEENVELSNRICTGLQLVNFWQDLSIDIPAGRLYIPRSALEHYNVPFQRLAEEQISPKFLDSIRMLLAELHCQAYDMLDSGAELIERLSNRRLKAEIAAVVRGGKMLNEKSRLLSERILYHRPRLTRVERAMLIVRSMPVLFRSHS